ncbi:TPA: phosphorylcholine transferase LicD [Streptococcus suis]
MLNKLHQVDLEIVKEVIEICKKHKLSYYMLGGTMLGAIRHKGFIPWDDDIDLGMPRKDYEKFLEVAQIELPKNMRVVNYRNTPNYQYYITRVQDTEFEVIEERIGNDSKFTYASIDIFPIDGSPNNFILRKIYFFRVLFHRAMMSIYYKDSIDRKRKRGTIERILLYVLEKLPFEKIINPNKEKIIIDRLLSSQDVSKSKFIGNIMGAYRTKEMVPKEWYGEGKLYKFEDIELIGLEMYDEYLKFTYGDYMQLPPEENRKSHYTFLEDIHE